MASLPNPTALFCFDFDGTLVDTDPHPPLDPRFLAFTNEVHAQGAVWAINTGRTLFHTLHGIAEHRFHPLPDFVMVKERELFVRGRFNRWFDLGNWNKECRREHKRFMKTHRHVFSQTRTFLEKHTKAQFIENRDDPAGIVATDEIEMGLICQFLDELIPKFPVLSYQRNSIYLRFAHSNYSKGTVLQELTRLLGITNQEVCAAGDNHNDLSMLHPDVSGFLACPSNAIPEVQQAVTIAGGVVSKGRASFGIVEALMGYTDIKV